MIRARFQVQYSDINRDTVRRLRANQRRMAMVQPRGGMRKRWRLGSKTNAFEVELVALARVENALKSAPRVPRYRCRPFCPDESFDCRYEHGRSLDKAALSVSSLSPM